MKTDDVSISRKRRITGNVLMILGGVMLIGSSSAKFAQAPAVITQLGAMGRGHEFSSAASALR